MSRTRWTTLLALAVVGGVAAIVLQVALAAASQPKLRPEFVLAATLVLIAAVVVLLAVPVRRATRSTGRRRTVDPFYATRVVLLGKASALAGALLTGAAAGLIVELLLRPAAEGGLLVRMLAMLGGSIALAAAGLIAEWMCTIPPTGPEDEVGPPPLDPAGGLES